MFAIIAFFMFSVSDIVKSNESQMILERLTQQASSLVNSSLYCDSIYYYFPSSIKVLGKSNYYRVVVSKTATGEYIGEDEISYVVFTLFPRKGDKAIAANSFRTTATVYFFRIEDTGRIVLADQDNPEDQYSVLDPQRIVEDPTEVVQGIDALVMVKQVISGKNYLFIVPCSHVSAICDEFLRRAAADTGVIDYEAGTTEPGFMCDSSVELCYNDAEKTLQVAPCT
jgi:hypothetical protein